MNGYIDPTVANPLRADRAIAAALDVAAIAADALAERLDARDAAEAEARLTAAEAAFVRACRMLRELPDGEEHARHIHDTFAHASCFEPPAWEALAETLRGQWTEAEWAGYLASMREKTLRAGSA